MVVILFSLFFNSYVETFHATSFLHLCPLQSNVKTLKLSIKHKGDFFYGGFIYTAPIVDTFIMPHLGQGKAIDRYSKHYILFAGCTQSHFTCTVVFCKFNDSDSVRGIKKSQVSMGFRIENNLLFWYWMRNHLI